MVGRCQASGTFLAAPIPEIPSLLSACPLELWETANLPQERSGKEGRNAQAQGVPRKGFPGMGMRSGITPEFSMAHSARRSCYTQMWQVHQNMGTEKEPCGG